MQQRAHDRSIAQIVQTRTTIAYCGLDSAFNVDKMRRTDSQVQ